MPALANLKKSCLSFRRALNNSPSLCILLINLVVFLAIKDVTPLALQPTDSTLWKLAHLITYQFAHANWQHFFGNMLMFMPVGLWLERRIGATNFCVLYLVSGVASALLFMNVLRLSDWSGLIGASGSISGVLAAAFLLYDRTPFHKALALGAFVAFFLPQLNLAILSSMLPIPVAFWGHVGGCLGGMLCLIYSRCYVRL